VLSVLAAGDVMCGPRYSITIEKFIFY